MLASFLLSGTAVAIAGLTEVPQLGNLETGVAATMVWKNALAGYLALLTPLAVTAFALGLRRGGTIGVTIAAAVLTAAMFFTVSQAGWLSLGFGLALVFILVAWGMRTSVWPLLRGVMFTVLLSAAAITALLQAQGSKVTLDERTTPGIDRVAWNVPASANYRLRYWETSVDIAAASPWLGVGLGNFTPWYTRRFRDPWLYTVSPHNYLLSLAVTAGFLAAALFAAFVMSAATKTVRWLRQAKSVEPARMILAVGWASAAGALLAHGLVDLSLEVPAIHLLWWLSLGLLYANVSANTEAKTLRPPRQFGQGVLALGSLGATLLLLFADNWYQQAKTLPYFGTVEKRIQLLRRSRTMMPLSADTAELLAETYWEAVLQHSGDRVTNQSAMLRMAQTAAALDPISAHRQWYLGYTYFRAQTRLQRDWPQIIAHFQQAIAYDFHDPTYYQSLAESYAATGRIAEALHTVDTALGLYPPLDLGRIVYGGLIYEQLGLKEKLASLQLLRERLQELNNEKATQQP